MTRQRNRQEEAEAAYRQAHGAAKAEAKAALEREWGKKPKNMLAWHGERQQQQQQQKGEEEATLAGPSATTTEQVDREDGGSDDKTDAIIAAAVAAALAAVEAREAPDRHGSGARSRTPLVPVRDQEATLADASVVTAPSSGSPAATAAAAPGPVPSPSPSPDPDSAPSLLTPAIPDVVASESRAPAPSPSSTKAQVGTGPPTAPWPPPTPPVSCPPPSPVVAPTEPPGRGDSSSQPSNSVVAADDGSIEPTTTGNNGGVAPLGDSRDGNQTTATTGPGVETQPSPGLDTGEIGAEGAQRDVKIGHQLGDATPSRET